MKPHPIFSVQFVLRVTKLLIRDILFIEIFQAINEEGMIEYHHSKLLTN
jgi:hypothetical protein